MMHTALARPMLPSGALGEARTIKCRLEIKAVCRLNESTGQESLVTEGCAFLPLDCPMPPGSELWHRGELCRVVSRRELKMLPGMGYQEVRFG